VESALRGQGIRTYHVQVLPWATTPERAADLWASLQSLWPRIGSGKLNLVCYAVGGLDCRYLVSPGGLFEGEPASRAEVLDRVAPSTEERVVSHCEGRYLRHDDTRDALHPLLWATVPFSFESRGADGLDATSPSDGMVSIESAKWGAFMGCLPADHYDVIG